MKSFAHINKCAYILIINRGTKRKMDLVLKELKAQERSIAWLGRQLGVSRTAVYNWAWGKIAPSRAYKLAIAYVLEKQYEELFN